MNLLTLRPTRYQAGLESFAGGFMFRSFEYGAFVRRLHESQGCLDGLESVDQVSLLHLGLWQTLTSPSTLAELRISYSR